MKKYRLTIAPLWRIKLQYIFIQKKEDLENLNKKKPNLGESWADKQKLFEEN